MWFALLRFRNLVFLGFGCLIPFSFCWSIMSFFETTSKVFHSWFSFGFFSVMYSWNYPFYRIWLKKGKAYFRSRPSSGLSKRSGSRWCSTPWRSRPSGCGSGRTGGSGSYRVAGLGRKTFPGNFRSSGSKVPCMFKRKESPYSTRWNKISSLNWASRFSKFFWNVLLELPWLVWKSLLRWFGPFSCGKSVGPGTGVSGGGSIAGWCSSSNLSITN